MSSQVVRRDWEPLQESHANSVRPSSQAAGTSRTRVDLDFFVGGFFYLLDSSGFNSSARFILALHSAIGVERSHFCNPRLEQPSTACHFCPFVRRVSSVLNLPCISTNRLRLGFRAVCAVRPSSRARLPRDATPPADDAAGQLAIQLPADSFHRPFGRGVNLFLGAAFFGLDVM